MERVQNFHFFFSEIVGIVENVEKANLVGKTEKSKKMLKKFNLGNLETKHLRVLIWEERRITIRKNCARRGSKFFIFKWSVVIFNFSNSIVFQIIHIEKAAATLPDLKWFPKDRNLVQMEININDNTVVKKLKKKIVNTPREYTPVNFQTILDSHGSIGKFSQIIGIKRIIKCID